MNSIVFAIAGLAEDLSVQGIAAAHAVQGSLAVQTHEAGFVEHMVL